MGAAEGWNLKEKGIQEEKKLAEIKAQKEMSGASEWTVVDSGLNPECEGRAEGADRSILHTRNCFQKILCFLLAWQKP